MAYNCHLATCNGICIYEVNLVLTLLFSSIHLYQYFTAPILVLLLFVLLGEPGIILLAYFVLLDESMGVNWERCKQEDESVEPEKGDYVPKKIGQMLN